MITKCLSPTTALRFHRMVYFFIKEVAETCNSDDIIIVTSSLTKDMNSNEDLFRANSIRVLAKVRPSARGRTDVRVLRRTSRRTKTCDVRSITFHHRGVFV